MTAASIVQKCAWFDPPSGRAWLKILFFARAAHATVYSAPQPSVSSYTYDIGQNVLIIMYTGDLLSSFLYVEYAVHEKSHYYGYHAGLRDLSESND